MAQIKLNPLFDSISGTIGDLTFRTMNGKSYMYRRSEPQLPPHPTRKQRAQYKKRCMVNDCVTLIQEQMDDIITAIRLRKTIYNHIARLYDKYAPTIKAKNKLQKAIMTDYFAQPNERGTSPVQSR